ncbi:MAG: hypothetical protein ACI9N9_000846 [Enterobacterales bacterium]|jgi:hypothetical protein
MILRQEVLNQFNRRKVKALTINAMGVAGIAIAILAILFSQDQVALLTQMTQELSQSPLGVVLYKLSTYTF